MAPAPRPSTASSATCPALLQPGDLLVFNDTQVVKARLFGEKPTGGKLELLVERVLAGREVVAHMKVSKKPPVGTVLRMDGGFTATLLGRWPRRRRPAVPLRLQRRSLRADGAARPRAAAALHRRTPTRRRTRSATRPCSRKNPGAVAAPTAALHFDDAVLAALDARGVQRASVTLHVGAGTFQPVKTEDIAAAPHAQRVVRGAARPRSRRSPTCARAAAASSPSAPPPSARWSPGPRTGQASGDTDIFITPGFRFRQVDLLVTNFHLPKSTLMMLVSAFAGYEHVMALYRHAIEQRYRFFSYGDAMLLARQP